MYTVTPRRSMRAVEIGEVGSAAVIDTTAPAPLSGQVLVQVRATGICGSDVAAYLGKHPFRIPPVITGHEVAGEIVGVGQGVPADRIGEHVVIEPQAGCTVCRHCQAGAYHLCAKKRVLGTAVWKGSFAEQIVAPAERAYPIDGSLPFTVASLIEPLSVGVHATRLVELDGAEHVAVLGCGTIGLTLLVALRAQSESGSGAGDGDTKNAGHGAAPRFLCSDLKPANRALALELGAGQVIDADADVVSEVLAVTDGLGAEITFVCASASGLVDQALQLTRRRGTVVLIATFGAPITLDVREVQLGERQLVGSAMYTRADFTTAIDLATQAPERLARLITDTIDLAEVPQALATLGAGGTESIKVVVDLDGAHNSG